MGTMQEFISKNRVRITNERTHSNPNMGDDFQADHWKVTLRMGKKQLTTYFSKGYGHKGAAPTAEEVLDCLASDVAGYENAADFEDWANEYGHDTDSRKAEKTYKIIEAQSKKLKKFLSSTATDAPYPNDDLYELLLWETERL